MAKHQFKTEVSRLLELIIHSLYSHKEIFLRELVSNASDALDKLAYLRVSDEAYKNIAFAPRIEVRIDNEVKTITILDNGLGMTAEELESHLGTIAQSGTKKFLENLPTDAKKDSNLIGQFGVGFYSAYMVADRVEVTSRRAGTTSASRWTSDGKGEYSVDPVGDFEGLGRELPGTEIKLFLNSEGEEFLSRWKLEELLKRYSNHIAYPIHLVSDDDDYDDKGQKKEGKKHVDEQVNAASALWRRPKSELKDEDYQNFYKGIQENSFMGGADAEALFWMHTHAEGTLEYTTLFFIPKKAPTDMYRADYKPGVKLYVKRVFITDDEKELLPVYLRFIRGVIDSEDLPLNVSREILQQNRVMSQIRSSSVKKILSEFTELSKNNPDKYKEFIEQYNRPLKEGLYSDYANKEALLGLVRFKSTSVEGWTSLADYKSRAKAEQKSIYYIAGDNEERLRKSPLLTAYKNEGFEVLICPDEIDEIVIGMLGPFDGLDFKAVNRAGSDEGLKKNETSAETSQEQTTAVERAKKILGELVKDVRISKRLADIPACIVLDGNQMSAQMRAMMAQMGGGNLPEEKPILELNGEHELVKKLASSTDEVAEDLAHVLLRQAQLIEGTSLSDPVEFAHRLNRLLKA